MPERQGDGQGSGQDETSGRDAAGLRDLEERRLRSLRHIEYMIASLLVIALIAAISLAKVAVLPIVLGFLFALTLAPLVRFLNRLGLPLGVGAVAVIGLIGTGSAFGLYMMSGPASVLVETVPQMQAAAESKLRTVREKLEQMQRAEEQVQAMTGKDRPGQEKIVIDETSMVDIALSSVAGMGSTLVVALILAMFLLATGDMFQHKLVQSFDRFGDKKRAIRISHDIERQISRYLGAITVINLCLGCAVGLALWALGLPYPYIWGVAAFALNYLPYLGSMMGIAAVAATSLVTYDSAAQMILPPLAYFVLTSIEGQMVTPLAGRAAPQPQRPGGLHRGDLLGLALGRGGGADGGAFPGHGQGDLRQYPLALLHRSLPRRRRGIRHRDGLSARPLGRRRRIG